MTTRFTLSIFLGLAAMVHAESVVYVSDASNQRIVVFSLDESQGKLSEVQSLDTKANPGSLAVSPDRKFLFASLRSTSQLASFAIDKTGKLTHLSTVSLEKDANATYVNTDRTGKYLLTASYHAGRVAVHAIADDGKLGEKPLQVIETVKTAHAAVISRDNHWLFVPHVTPNAIYQFHLKEETGHLVRQKDAEGGKPEAGPRHLALHPSGDWAFSSDETGSSITLYSINEENGLVPAQNLSTLPDDFTGQNTTADVKLHPNGEFVWVSNRGHDSLAGFRFSTKPGKLAALGQTPTEKTPRSFDISLSGSWLFAAGEGSGNLAIYRVDEKTGAIERTGTQSVGKSLTWVLAVEK